MPYYTYFICNYWVINKILFEYYWGFDFITIFAKDNKIEYRVLNKFAKTYGLYILIALINLIFFDLCLILLKT